ncbi:MAG: hypothetical protein WCZ02_06005 [Lysobacterales bacterium]
MNNNSQSQAGNVIAFPDRAQRVHAARPHPQAGDRARSYRADWRWHWDGTGPRPEDVKEICLTHAALFFEYYLERKDWHNVEVIGNALIDAVEREDVAVPLPSGLADQFIGARFLQVLAALRRRQSEAGSGVAG